MQAIRLWKDADCSIMKARRRPLSGVILRHMNARCVEWLAPASLGVGDPNVSWGFGNGAMPEVALLARCSQV